MSQMTAKDSGTFQLGGDLTINRLGYGAMQITGKGVWDEPADRDEALRVLRRLPDLNINFIDTADSYGPFVSEDLIREALHPYPADLVIATKGGFTRHGPGIWVEDGSPAYLRQCVMMSLRRLKLERIDLWQLHRIDPKIDRNVQFQVIADMQREGLIRHVGLSEVSIEEIEAAAKHFPVVSVQNLFNLVHRRTEDVLDYCERENIAFIPWFPLANGDLAQPGSVLDDICKRLDASPAQVALAWVLQRSPVMLPIPGTSKVAHLEQNTAAAGLTLSEEDLQALDAAGRKVWEKE